MTRTETPPGKTSAGAPPLSRLPRPVALALLVLRAGEKDGLGWWDDNALTSGGEYALARLFPRTPKRTALRLALEAARARHRGVLTAAGRLAALTLLELAAPGIWLLEALPDDLEPPIASAAALREQMAAIAPGVLSAVLPAPDASGLLDLSALAPVGTDVEEQAVLLAAGYLRGDRGRSVYPFILAGTGGGA